MPMAAHRNKSIESALVPPNVVLILLDDVGYGASSVFGGLAEMPHLEALAARGLQFNRFHVNPSCSPTRASLLSGRSSHRVGFGSIVEWSSNQPGYHGRWGKEAASVAELLRRAGYSTAAFGKWHNTPPDDVTPDGPFDRWPTRLGFDYFYGFIGGEDSQWEPTLHRGTAPVEPRATPEAGYHLTSDLADDAIRWLTTHDAVAPHRPYFLYFATGAQHIPHHVPPEWIERYRGRFDEGWDELARRVLDRQIQMGIVPDGVEIARPGHVPAWDSQDPEHRRLLARQMEVAAGFLSHTDHEIGRVLEAVASLHDAANTLVLYIVGDNGAQAGGEDGKYEFGLNPPGRSDLIEEIDLLGTEHLMNNGYASGWTWVDSVPFRGTKGSVFLGGTRAPLIASWPARIAGGGAIRHEYLDVTDVAATLYDLAGVTFPETVDGVAQLDLDGRSFAAQLVDDLPDSPQPTESGPRLAAGGWGIYHRGWLAVNPTQTDLERSWELYDLDRDFNQRVDCASSHGDKLDELLNAYRPLAADARVEPFDRSKSEIVGRAQQTGRSHFTYRPNVPRLTLLGGGISPDFTRGHRIAATVEIGKDGTGVIVAAGSRSSGFAFYMLEGHLFYEVHPPRSAVQTVVSSVKIPGGKVQLSVEFAPDPQHRNRLETYMGPIEACSGVASLRLDGEVVGRGAVGPIIAAIPAYCAHRGTLGIGQAWTTLLPSFRPPFPFEGTIERVDVVMV